MIGFLFIIVFFAQQQQRDKTNDSSNNDNDQTTILWGVDSASYVDDDLYTCVREEFGEPKIWGRYLGDIEGVSAGLDEDEVDYLHKQGTHILVIYNHFSDATGYEHGVEEAKKARSLAENLEIPDGVAIFGDIEPKYPVDASFIDGWYDTLNESNYVPALYGVFNEESDLRVAYDNAQDQVRKNTIIWTAYPQEGITREKDAPSFNPTGPSKSNLYGWQYGQDAKTCHIDTNLFTESILNYMWKKN